MNDIYARYKLGVERLLESLSSNRDLFLDVCSFQHNLNISIHKLRTYGDGDPDGNANLLRSLKQLDQVCFEMYKMSFNSWCDRIALEKQDEDDADYDPLYPYIGNWEALQDGKLQHFLRRELTRQGIYIDTKRPIPVEDTLERSSTVPLNAIILYTSRDLATFTYITKQWDFLDSLSRDICDIHVSVAQLNGSEDANDVLESPYLLESMNIHPLDLPGIIFWDQCDNGEFVSFGRNADDEAMTQIWLRILGDLRIDPSITAIRRAKAVIDQSRPI